MASAEDQASTGKMSVSQEEHAESTSTLDESLSTTERQSRVSMRKRMSCKKCFKVFKSFVLLMRHIQEHKEDHPFTCDVCGRMSGNRTTYQNHFETHRVDNVFKCGECSESFEDQTGFAMHLKTHLNFVCHECNKVFAKESKFDDHMKRHKIALETGESMESLGDSNGDEGQDVFSVLFEEEAKDEVAKPVYVYMCSICNQFFGNQGALKLHAAIHAKPDEKPFKCPHCPREFSNKGGFMTHVRSHNVEPAESMESDTDKDKGHSDPESTPLSVDPESTPDSAKSQDQDWPEKPFKCSICPRQFGNKGGFTTHLKSHEAVESYFDKGKVLFRPESQSSGGNGKSHVCKHCQKAFSDKDKLNAHVRSHKRKQSLSNVHEEQSVIMKPVAFMKGNFYVCEFCDCFFRNKKALVSHVKIHLPKQKHTCDTCGRDFPMRSAMLNHAKTHEKPPAPKEKPDRPFECEHCGKGYENEEKMVKHAELCERVQEESRAEARESGATPAKRFLCDHCDKVLTTMAAMWSHERSHSFQGKKKKKKVKIPDPKKPYECPHCCRLYEDEEKLAHHVELCKKVQDQFGKATVGQQFVCDYCQVVFSSMSSVINHEKKHTNKLWKCEICNIGYPKSMKLSHMVSQHPEKCSWKVKEREVEASTLEEPEEDLESYIPQAKRRRTDGLKEALPKKVRKLRKPLFCKCHLCGQVCANHGILKLHLLRHDGGKFTARHCYKCSRTFSTKRKYANHLNWHVLDKKTGASRTRQSEENQEDSAPFKKSSESTGKRDRVQKRVHVSCKRIRLDEEDSVDFSVYKATLSKERNEVTAEMDEEMVELDQGAPVESGIAKAGKSEGIRWKVIDPGQEGHVDRGSPMPGKKSGSESRIAQSDEERALQRRCEVCKRSFNNRGSLISHLRVHGVTIDENDAMKGESPAKNEVSFPLKVKASLHKARPKELSSRTLEDDTKSDKRKAHKRDELELQHKCEFCKRTFQNRGALSSHLRVHNATSEANDALKEDLSANKVFSSLTTEDGTPKPKMNTNVRTNESPKQGSPLQHRCEFCKRMFQNRAALISHLKVHKATVETNDALKEDLGTGNDVFFPLTVGAVSSKNAQNCGTPTAKKNTDGRTSESPKQDVVDTSLQRRCEFCKRIFQNRAALISHLKVHNATVEDNDALKEGSEVYFPLTVGTPTSKIGQKRGTPTAKKKADVHRSESPKQDVSNSSLQHRCEFCKRIFQNRAALISHLKVHNATVEDNEAIKEDLGTGSEVYFPLTVGTPSSKSGQKSGTPTAKKNTDVRTSESPRRDGVDSVLQRRCEFCKRILQNTAALTSHLRVHNATIEENYAMREEFGKKSEVYFPLTVDSTPNPVQTGPVIDITTENQSKTGQSKASQKNRKSEPLTAKPAQVKSKTVPLILKAAPKMSSSGLMTVQAPVGLSKMFKLIPIPSKTVPVMATTAEPSKTEHLTMKAPTILSKTEQVTVETTQIPSGHMRVMLLATPKESTSATTGPLTVKPAQAPVNPSATSDIVPAVALAPPLPSSPEPLSIEATQSQRETEPSTTADIPTSKTDEQEDGGSTSEKNIDESKTTSTKEEALLRRKCEVCMKIFPKRRALISHLKAHKDKPEQNTTPADAESEPDEYEYALQRRCEFCKKVHQNRGALISHLRTHKATVEENEAMKEGLVAREEIMSQEETPGEDAESEPDEYEYALQRRCEFCKKLYRNRGTLINHLRSHKATFEENEAKKEGLVAREEITLPLPETPTQSKPSEPVVVETDCKICLKTFHNKRALSTHMKVHQRAAIAEEDESPEIVWRCTFCDGTFDTRVAICVHSREKHKFSGDFNDVIQSGYFDNDGEFILKSSDVPSNGWSAKWQTSVVGERRKVCNYCARKFTTRSGLISHLHHAHKATPDDNDAMEPVPGVCDESAESSEDIFLNYMFECEICNKQFENKEELIVHLKVHTRCTFSATHAANLDQQDLNKYIRKMPGHVPQPGPVEESEPKPVSLPTQCNICEMTFVTKSALTTHMQSHVPLTKSGKQKEQSEEGKLTRVTAAKPQTVAADEAGKSEDGLSRQRSFSCQICGKVCGNLGSLRQHLQKHDPSKYTFCYECNKKYVDRETLLYHVKSHFSEVFECDECPLIVGSQEDLETHMHRHATGEIPDLEEQQRMYEEAVKQIMSDAEGFRETDSESLSSCTPYICQICGRSFGNAGSLRNHTRIHDENRYIKCPSCDKTYFSRVSLRIHMNTHASDVTNCLKCDKTFTNEADLKKHEEWHEMHKFMCVKCELGFDEKGAYDEHMDVHRSDFTCVPCEKIFSNQSALDEHMLTHCIDMKSLNQCTHCERSFPNQDALERHMLTHRREKALLCEKCGESFRTRHEILSHACSSDKTSVDSFACWKCGKEYATKGALYVHSLSHKSGASKVHTNTKRARKDIHQCEVCPKRFDTEQDLKEHQIVHQFVDETNRDCEGEAQKMLVESACEDLDVVEEAEVDDTSPQDVEMAELADDDDDVSEEVHPASQEVPLNPPKVVTRLIGLAAEVEDDNSQEEVHESMEKTESVSVETQGVVANVGDVFQEQQDVVSAEVLAAVVEQEVTTEADKSDLVIASDGKDRQYIIYGVGEDTVAIEVQTERVAVLNEANSETLQTEVFKCTFCTSLYYTLAQLKEHMMEHQDEIVQIKKKEEDKTTMKELNCIHRCPHCDKCFKNSQGLNSHKLSHESDRNVECQICSKVFSCRGFLDLHLKGHTNPFKCEICELTFSTKSSLQLHRISHNKEKDYKCELCDRTFGYKGAFVSHVASHTGMKPHQCDLCGRVFGNKGSLQSHVRSHNADKTEECKVCGKMFGNVGALKSHMHMHGLAGQKYFRCDKCEKMFGNKGALQRHLNKHKALARKSKEKCERCGLEFTDNILLLAHVAAHDNDSECQECDMKCDDAGALESHKKEAHFNMKCERCNVEFKNRKKYDLHVLQSTPPIQCHICYADFGYECVYKAHLKTHPDDDVTPTCQFCQAKFRSTFNLRVHLKQSSDHYKCDYCNSSFSYSCELRLHKKRHTEGMDFQCSTCGKKYSQGSHLIYHMRSHRNERQHVCKYCDKRFLQLSHLKTHIQSHTGVRNYKCVVCSKRFIQHSHLRYHVTAVHGPEVAARLLAPVKFKGRKYMKINKSSRPRPTGTKVSLQETAAVGQQTITIVPKSGDSDGTFLIVPDFSIKQHGLSSGSITLVNESNTEVEINPEDIINKIKEMEATHDLSNAEIVVSTTIKSENELAVVDAISQATAEQEFEQTNAVIAVQQDMKTEPESTVSGTECVDENILATSIACAGITTEVDDGSGSLSQQGPDGVTIAVSEEMPSDSEEAERFIKELEIVTDCGTLSQETAVAVPSVDTTARRDISTTNVPFVQQSVSEIHLATDTAGNVVLPHSVSEQVPLQGGLISDVNKAEDIEVGGLSITLSSEQAMTSISELEAATSLSDLCSWQEVAPPNGNESPKTSAYSEQTYIRSKPFSCKQCNKSFYQSSHLKTHMRTHSGERPYVCGVCEKGFVQMCHLKLHLQSHGNAPKKLGCKHCGKSFLQNRPYINHMFSEHGVRLNLDEPKDEAAEQIEESLVIVEKGGKEEEDKKFSCPYCPRKFLQKYSLKLHLRNHTGIRPHQCNVCDKTYMQRSHLKNHMRTSHGLILETVRVPNADSGTDEEAVDEVEEIQAVEEGQDDASNDTIVETYEIKIEPAPESTEAEGAEAVAEQEVSGVEVSTESGSGKRILVLPESSTPLDALSSLFLLQESGNPDEPISGIYILPESASTGQPGQVVLVPQSGEEGQVVDSEHSNIILNIEEVVAETS